MPDDRRTTRRARLSGVRVSYENAVGEIHQADVTDMSREGLFISSVKPLGVGKRISLEIQVAGEPGPWAALGRIVWVRQSSEGDELPSGMAVKIIDMDDSVAAAIDRLIETRERTEPGLGDGDAAPKDLEKPRRAMPAREKTMLGVGVSEVASPPAASAASTAPTRAVGASAPDRAVATVPAPNAPAARPLPSREKTIVGVGQAVVDTREASLAIDLVAKKPASVRPSPAATQPHPAAPSEALAAKANEFDEPEGPAEPTHPRASETPAPRRRSGSGWLLLLLLVACGVGGYAFRDRLLPLLHVAVTMVLRQVH